MARHTSNHPANGPIDGPADNYMEEKPTGLLTRFVPNKLRHGSFYRWFLRFTRVLQFVSSVISLGAFSQRLYKVYRIVNVIKTRRGVSGSYGAVEGILAAAVLYTLISMLLGCIKKSANPGGKALRWIWVVLDLAFVGAFIAVSVLTSPDGGIGKAGPNNCYDVARVGESGNFSGRNDNNDDSCNLPWATFILAIIST
jgi:hypothetical protein